MGRAARECSEPRRARSGRGALRRWDGLRVDVPAVDPRLEAATDVLARREQCVVADAPRRELHDPHGLVTIAVTACVRSRLVERPQAIAITPKPCHTWTPTMSRRLGEPGRAGRVPLFADETLAGRRLSSRACTTRDPSCGPRRRSTGARLSPARSRSGRDRRGAARSSPSGTAPGTRRSGRRCAGRTRTARRRAPPGSGTEDAADGAQRGRRLVRQRAGGPSAGAGECRLRGRSLLPVRARLSVWIRCCRFAEAEKRGSLNSHVVLEEP